MSTILLRFILKLQASDICKSFIIILMIRYLNQLACILVFLLLSHFVLLVKKVSIFTPGTSILLRQIVFGWRLNIILQFKCYLNKKT
ncbi:hypothetical protein BIY27_08185 [Gibbsiella quercinecans]|nr:hypothetical protein BIY27_08185 [Gibbsiella quercinecans]